MKLIWEIWGQMVYVINYGVASGRIDYIVVEVGSKEVNSHFDENLRQIVTADGMSVNLSGTHRMFCVDGESVYSIQLDLKLSDIEERPGEIKMAGLKRINNLLETNFSHVLSIIHKN